MERFWLFYELLSTQNVNVSRISFFKHCANGFKNEIMYRIFAVSSYFVGYESTEGWGTIKRANLSVKLRCPATLLPKGSMTLLCVTNAVQGLNMKGWTRLLRSYTLFCGQGEMISLKQKTFDLALQRKGYKAQCLKISEKVSYNIASEASNAYI